MNKPTTIALADKRRDWYLVQSKPKQDERAEENLVRQGYVCCRPRCRRQRLVRGTSQFVEESLFPGYLFIHMPAGTNWTPLSSTRGVTKVVAFGGRPLAVADELIEALQLRSSIELATYSDGDEAIVTVEGELSGVDSIFVSIDGGERVLLLMDIMCRQAKLCMQ